MVLRPLHLYFIQFRGLHGIRSRLVPWTKLPYCTFGLKLCEELLIGLALYVPLRIRKALSTNLKQWFQFSLLQKKPQCNKPYAHESCSMGGNHTQQARQSRESLPKPSVASSQNDKTNTTTIILFESVLHLTVSQLNSPVPIAMLLKDQK